MGRHSDDPDTGQQAYLARLYQFAQALQEFAQQNQDLRRQATETQPTARSLASDITEVAGTVSVAAAEAAGWKPSARAQLDRDHRRIETPRGNRHVESRADVGAAMRDM